MARLNKEREQRLQPKRLEFAKKELEKLNVEIVHEDETKIQFLFKGAKINFFPYSGWFSGKTVKDGRGIDNLIKQLK